MRKTRVILTVALVATALCADRAAAATPVLRPQLTEAARSFADRLSSNLRRVIATVRLTPQRQSTGVVIASVPRRSVVAPVVHASQLSPFQFRLPPPVI